jgi:hypothetical protein
LGLNQLYFTYGLGFDIWLVNISFASYTEELGYRYKQNADTRVALQIDVRLPI